MLTLNLSHLEPCSYANGPGARFVVWMQGCTIGCHGCCNQHTWSHAPRLLMPIQRVYDQIITHANTIEGVSFTGGEPFEQAEALAVLCRMLKTAGLSVVCFTGHTLTHLRTNRAPTGSHELLKHIDILKDGRYMHKQKTDDLPLRGSHNQQLHFLSGRYAVDDVAACPRAEIMIGNDGITSTGFMPKPKELLLLQRLGIALQED